MHNPDLFLGAAAGTDSTMTSVPTLSGSQSMDASPAGSVLTSESMNVPQHMQQLQQLQQLHSSHEQHQQGQSKEDVALASFTALLSSAQLTGTCQPMMASEEPALANLMTPRGQAVCVFPSLTAKGGGGASKAKDISLQESAALRMSTPVTAARSEVSAAPVLLLNNVSESFMGLVESRLKSSVNALRQTFKMMLSANDVGADGEALAMTNMLDPCNDPIKITTVVTSFRVLPAVGGAGDDLRADRRSETVLPLIFQAIIDLDALNGSDMLTVAVRAPGTVTGTTNLADSLIERLEVSLDSAALLKAMMKQARSVVKKTIALAAGMARSAREKQVAAAESVGMTMPLCPTAPPILHKSASLNKLFPQALSSCSSFSAMSSRTNSVGPGGSMFTKPQNEDHQHNHYDLRKHCNSTMQDEQHEQQTGNAREESLPLRLFSLLEHQPVQAQPGHNALFNNIGSNAVQQELQMGFFQSVAPWMQNDYDDSVVNTNAGATKDKVAATTATSSGNENQGQKDTSLKEQQGADKMDPDRVDDLTPRYSINELFSKFNAEIAAQKQKQQASPLLAMEPANKRQRVQQQKKTVSFSSFQESFS